jgi:tryptophan synthase alpha chain
LGIKAFCIKCKEIGIDGVILPDLPPDLYKERYEVDFIENNLSNVLLVPPQTSDKRIKELDKLSTGFLYIVATSSTTGIKKDLEQYQIDYFNRLQQLKLSSPTLIGFGISDKESFNNACKYANGAIIGSAFIKALESEGDIQTKVSKFIKSVIG